VLLLLLLWIALAGTLYTIATTHPPLDAFARWLILMGVLCLVGGGAIRSQSLEEPTFLGRLGSVAVHWGFRASHGRLWAATIISWLIWLVIGAGAIGALHFRDTVQPMILSLGWATEVLLLFYLVGMWLANAGASPAFRMKFVSMAGMVLLLLASSLFLWFGTRGTTRAAAVIIAAMPLGATLLYGVFVAVMVLVGGKARWN
jgi:hypothetical protein